MKRICIGLTGIPKAYIYTTEHRCKYRLLLLGYQIRWVWSCMKLDQSRKVGYISNHMNVYILVWIYQKISAFNYISLKPLFIFRRGAVLLFTFGSVFWLLRPIVFNSESFNMTERQNLTAVLSIFTRKEWMFAKERWLQQSVSCYAHWISMRMSWRNIPQTPGFKDLRGRFVKEALILSFLFSTWILPHILPPKLIYPSTVVCFVTTEALIAAVKLKLNLLRCKPCLFPCIAIFLCNIVGYRYSAKRQPHPCFHKEAWLHFTQLTSIFFSD